MKTITGLGLFIVLAIAFSIVQNGIRYKMIEHRSVPYPHSSGFTLVEIMIVAAIIGVLAVIAIPSFQRAMINSQNTAFINDLRIINGAIN